MAVESAAQALTSCPRSTGASLCATRLNRLPCASDSSFGALQKTEGHRCSHVRRGSLVALALAGVMALAGCGSQSADTSRAGAPEPSNPKLLRDCRGWFGGGVAAALCASHATGTLVVRISGRQDPTRIGGGARSGDGAAARKRGKVEISGNVSRGSILLVRLEVGSIEHVSTAWFTLPHLPQGGIGSLTVSGPSGSPKAVLNFGLRRLTADGVSIPKSAA
jgi:hypothetical protein